MKSKSEIRNVAPSSFVLIITVNQQLKKGSTEVQPFFSIFDLLLGAAQMNSESAFRISDFDFMN